MVDAAVDAEAALAAAEALISGGRWDAADRLLVSLRTSDCAVHAQVALARAHVAVDLREWRGIGDPAPALEAAAEAVTAIGDSDSGPVFDSELLQLFAD